VTKDEMRVAVARDVVARLDAESLQVTKGYYARFTGSDKAAEAEIRGHAGGGAAAVADAIERRCSVCALGACLLSKLRVLGDDPGDVVDALCEGSLSLSVEKELAGVFTPAQQAMIECAFEVAEQPIVDAKGEDGDDLWDAGDCKRACSFGERYAFSGERARLRAIMSNVIENGGTFKP
jgi:hypothetical protein